MLNKPEASGAPIIYVVGRTYEPAHDGLARRLQIVTRFLEARWPHRRRLLVAPASPYPAGEMKERGWEWLPADSTHHIKPKLLRIPVRVLQLLRWRWLGKGGDEILTLAGGSCLRFDKVARTVVGLKDAWVLVGRCEFAGLIRHRQPGQRWALDSQDTVTNLERTYDNAAMWRKAAGFSRNAWLDRLKRQELEYARSYDRIVSISPEDHEFYAPAIGSNVFLEDTAVVLPDRVENVEQVHDIGYIGGTHKGSVETARHLLALARIPSMSRFQFVIAGGVCQRLNGENISPNVTLLGKVADSFHFLRQCRTVLQWAAEETGTSVKFQEALAAGSVVVANRNAARFSLARAGLTHLEARTPEEVGQLYAGGEAFRFQAEDLRHHFAKEAFHKRFEHALGWAEN